MKKEYIFATLITLAVLLAANLSFIVPYLFKNDDLVFLGRHRINSEDTYTYVSSIEQARQGRILFENQYTSEPQTPSLLRPSYVLIGNAARVLGITSLAAYHLFRVLFSVIFCIVLYKFLFLFFDSKSRRLTAFTIILISTGLGFLLYKIVPNPIDVWIPEAFTFLSFTEAPHFMLSLALLLFGFYFFIKYLKERNENLLLFTFFAFLLLAFEHPFDLVVAVPVLVLTALWHKISLPKAILIGALSGMGLIYQVLETYKNPILSAWQAQNILYSPQPTAFLAGFGLLIAFGLFGIEIFARELKLEQKFIITWLALIPVLIYIPISFQRRLIEGAQIPLAIVAFFGIEKVLQKVKEKRRNMFLVLTIIVLSLSSVFSIYEDFFSYKNDSKESPYYYIKPENLEAIAWLGQNTNFNDVILSNRNFGNIIPGIIGRKVFLGHAIQTINLTDKINETNAFLLEKDDGKAVSFLKENHITYIFLGSNDSMLTYGFNPGGKSYLTKIYDKAGATIYKVK